MFSEDTKALKQVMEQNNINGTLLKVRMNIMKNMLFFNQINY